MKSVNYLPLSGTTSITYEILKHTIESITDWWRTQELRNFILLTFHGDPFHIKAMTDLAEDTLLIELYEIENYVGSLSYPSDTNKDKGVKW